MSIARVTVVNKSIKPGTCEKCRTELPKGSAYRHFKVGFRSRYKHVRCMSDACTPRASELESSKIAAVYAAQEDAGDALDALDETATAEDIEEIVRAVAEACREVASEYEEASTDDNGTVWNTDAEERAGTLNDAADTLDDFDSDHTTDCEACSGAGTTNEGQPDDTEEECDDCGGEGTVFDAEAAVDAARDAINEVELP